MKHIKTFDQQTNEELRRDKMTWYGRKKGEDRKPGVKGFKGTKDYKDVRHQSNKGDRQEAKTDIKKGKIFEDKISFRAMKENEDSKNHTFFKDVENIKRMAEEILMMDPEEVESILNKDTWVSENIGKSKIDIQEAYDFLWSD